MGSLRKDALTPALSPWERGQTANALSLRERVRVRGVTFLLKRFPQFMKIIDLTVEGDHIASRRRHHGLMAFRRQIENGQPAMRQGDTRNRIQPHPTIIGSTMKQRVRHGGDLLPRPLLAAGVKTDKSRYTAHD
jgi:hypothetical protein